MRKTEQKRKGRQRNNKMSHGFSDMSQAYFKSHAYALFASLGRLVGNPFTSTMTIAVLAIAISLASAFYLFVINIQQLSGAVESTNQISLFLKNKVSDKEGKKLADELRNNEDIEQVILISKQQALDEFKSYSGFGKTLDLFENNPLPIVVQVLPKNSLDHMKSVKRLMKEFDRLPQVDLVQMDMQWIKKLQSIIGVMNRGVLLLAILLGFAVLFITGNTIRLELQNRRDEVVVAKLVGATYSFIQRPFLYTGFWLGFLSGLLAWIFVLIMLLVLQDPIEQLSVQYDGSFILHYLSFTDTLFMLFVASTLGVMGAWIVLRFQIKQIQPE